MMPVSNADNNYAGGTVVAYSGLAMDRRSGTRSRVNVAPTSKLGKGDLIIEPGGEVLLPAPTNLSPTAIVTMRSSGLAHAVLDVGYNGLPRLSKDSNGLIAIEAKEFDALADLSAVGDGRMSLAAGFDGRNVVWPTFTRRTLAPGAGNVYRLGGGNPPPGWSLLGQMLRVRYGVLVGSASLEVGTSGYKGVGGVRLDGANTFTGPIAVRGGIIGEGVNAPADTLLQGLAQDRPGASPFGSPQGAVRLYNGALGVVAERLDAQPVNKGSLLFSGLSRIDLLGKNGHPAVLTLADLQRDARCKGIVVIAGATGKLQAKEKLWVASWKDDRPLLPPYILCQDGKDVAFACYDARTGKGLGKAATARQNLKTATADEVVSCGATVLGGEEILLKSLRTTGAVSGTGKIHILRGGLLLGGDLAADIDFAGVEGVIVGADRTVLSGRISGNRGLCALARA